jgi:hypothetical protein
VAGKSRHWPWFSALRAAGVPIISTWLDWKHNRETSEPPSADAWANHSETCLREAGECTVLLLYVREDETHFGALLEAGAALAHGKRVFLVSPHEWPFLRNHPRVRSFDSIEAAVAGEQARKQRNLK